MSRPQEWSSWAPHVRGAWGLGESEVRVGARGYARLLGVVPIPATITAVDPGRSWTWKVGPVEMVHRVDPTADGCAGAGEISAPAP
ncbi:MAG: SRPBCC family protein, partial [Actinobacteria bacterium]|nr:SRPBCC family protein [Actinomycetota bacterium]